MHCWFFATVTTPQEPRIAAVVSLFNFLKYYVGLCVTYCTISPNDFQLEERELKTAFYPRFDTVMLLCTESFGVITFVNVALLESGRRKM